MEILGAVSGFFGAFGSATMVLIAGSTTAVAGSPSMAAGIYVAISSEREITATETDKKRFLSSQGLLLRISDDNVDRLSHVGLLPQIVAVVLADELDRLVALQVIRCEYIGAV